MPLYVISGDNEGSRTLTVAMCQQKETIKKEKKENIALGDA